MKGNPTAGIILLVVASLLIALGTQYRDRLKGAFSILLSGQDTNSTDMIQYWKDTAELYKQKATQLNGGTEPTFGSLKTPWSTKQ